MKQQRKNVLTMKRQRSKVIKRGKKENSKENKSKQKRKDKFLNETLNKLLVLIGSKLLPKYLNRSD
jgi:hypothetical protein